MRNLIGEEIFKLEPKIEFIDWKSESRKAIYSKFIDPTTIADCKPETFTYPIEPTVGNPNPKDRTIIKKL